MKDLIWYEKYRATNLDDLILEKNTLRNMKQYIKRKEIPHLLFHGPAGSGKTTLALILIKACASAKLILNASSEDRGVETIKKKVKQFASAQRRHKKKLNIVLLDEADGLTPDAQKALKNTIESYQANCRFIFTANEIDRITDPIYSRCTLFRFESMPTEYFVGYLEGILKKEKVSYKTKNIKKLIDRFGTDVRTILNNLQAGSISGMFKLKDILDIFDTEDMKDYLDEGQIGKIRKVWRGYKDFVWFYKFIFNDYVDSIDDEYKAEVAIVTAEYLYKNTTVADREINATACCLEIMNIMGTNVEF